MLSYILVVSTGYVLLLSIYPMLKAGKMHSTASSAILSNLFKNYFIGAKTVLTQLRKDFINCFVLEVSTVDTEWI